MWMTNYAVAMKGQKIKIKIKTTKKCFKNKNKIQN